MAVEEIAFQHNHKRKIKSFKVVQCDEIDYSLKYADRSLLNELFSLREEHDDILIVKNGLLTDTSYCNIVLENNQQFFTPGTPLLKGTKREELLQSGLIQEAYLTVSDLVLFKRIHFINAMLDLHDLTLSL